jgi:iron complex transport system substrate-binding protein
LNAEQVIVANPEQVVVTTANWEAFAPGGHWVGVGPGADLVEARRKLQWYTQRPAYTGIKAQQTLGFHAIWHQFYNSPYQFIAIQQLAKWFHPDLFAEREFHERFLPVPYEPGYFVSLKPAQAQP